MDTDTARFVTRVSIATRIDPRVVIAWVQHEGGGSPKGVGHFNYLNLRPQAGDRYSGVTHTKSNGDFEAFNSVDDAVYSTVRRINSGHAIKATAQTKPTPSQQIDAIGQQGWGSNIQSLKNTFTSIFGKGSLNDSYVGPEQAGPIAATAGTGSASDKGSYDAGNAAHDAGAAARHIPGVEQILSIGDFIKWIGGNWDRVLIVGGGAILVVMGLVFVVSNTKGGQIATAVATKGKV